MSADTNLNNLIPIERFIDIKGDKVELKNIKIGKLSRIVTLLQPMAAFLPKPGDTPKKNPINFAAIILHHTDDAIDLLAVLLDRPREWVANLDMDDFVLLLSSTVEANLDFFIQKVLPCVSAAMGKLGGALLEVATSPSIGDRPSNG